MQNTQYLVDQILQSDPLSRGNDKDNDGYKYLIAKVWVTEAIKKDDPEFEVKFQKTYKFLLSHSNPSSILKYKDDFFKNHHDLKYLKGSTTPIQRELSGEQILDIGKKYLDEMKEVLKK